MRRLFGLKAKGGPLEPLSPNTDTRKEQSTPISEKPTRSTTNKASAPGARPGPTPSGAAGAREDSTRSLHAHFASSPIVHPLSSPVSTTAEDPSASLRAESSTSLAAGSTGRPTKSRASPARGTLGLGGPADDESRGVLAHHQQRNVSPASLALHRTVSPLSFAPSGSYGGAHSPYYGGGGSSLHPSLARVASERGQDPNAIYAPTTWSELANPELVDNVSNRERTRQEILWEVVASEERYVLELRSLIIHYINPLLHPLLKPAPPPLPPSPPTAHFPSPPSSSELPIAARFQRSNNNSEISLVQAPVWNSGREMPEIDGSDESISHGSRAGPSRSRMSLPVLPRDARPSFSIFGSSHSLAHPPSEGKSGRLSAFSFRSKQSARPTLAKPSPSKEPVRALNEDGTPLALPEPLRNVLESLVDMLQGHEDLSAKLKEQWARAFPLVRGLAAIWSEQPWFLQTYAKYVLSLEEALGIVDELLPSAHSTAPSMTHKLKRRTSFDKTQKRLACVLVSLEEQASLAGESGLGICLSKPLMRLAKLPLLMQALLYHTDPTTNEWEKTRAMALEVDALVRSIEDEKIDEEAREKTRDALARIEGIKDKALMAPRSSRVLLDEIPVQLEPTSRRAAPGIPSRKSKGNEWFVRFSDVTIRCVKTRETDLPGGFSRQKEKQGKQGKVKKGKPRNLYRFVRIERWETPSATEGANGIQGDLAESSEEEIEDEMDDAESRMSFRYDSDEPKPAAPRNFTQAPITKTGLRSSSATHSVVTKQSPATAKHGARLRIASEGSMPRVTSPVSRHRFDAPTKASAAKNIAPRSSTPRPPSPRNGLHVREDSLADLLQAGAAWADGP